MHSAQPLSTSQVTSQSQPTPWRHNSNTKTLLWAHVDGTEIVFKSTDRRSKIFFMQKGLTIDFWQRLYDGNPSAIVSV